MTQPQALVRPEVSEQLEMQVHQTLHQATDCSKWRAIILRILGRRLDPQQRGTDSDYDYKYFESHIDNVSHLMNLKIHLIMYTYYYSSIHVMSYLLLFIRFNMYFVCTYVQSWYLSYQKNIYIIKNQVATEQNQNIWKTMINSTYRSKPQRKLARWKSILSLQLM